MKTRFLISVFATTLISTAYALPLTALKNTLHRPYVNVANTQLAAVATKFTNFSGTWKGSCDNQDEEDTVVIKNNAKSISFITDDVTQTLLINGKEQIFIENTDEGKLTTRSITTWNGPVLNSKQNMVFESADSSPVNTVELESNISLVTKSILNIDVAATYTDTDAQTTDAFNFHCIYNKIK